MPNISLFASARWVVTLASLAFLASCSGGGCPSCNVPTFTAPTLAPGATPTPPGFIPTPKPTPPPTPVPTPTPTPTPVPTPTPTPVPPSVACSQGGPNTIALGAAAPFALFGNAGITNTGITNVTYASGATSTTLQNGFGNFNDDLIGAYPTTAVVTGGTLTDADGPSAIYGTGAAGYSSNAAFTTAAEGAVTTAFTNANAEAPTAPTFTGGFDLSQVPAGYSGHANCGPAGNQPCPLGTLGAGVYKSASTLSITQGPLTLDGGGNPQSVFVFQIGSALTMAAPGGTVFLINGANGCNIYWADLSGATLGGVGGAQFYGNILATAGGIVIDPVLVTFGGRALSANNAGTSGSVTISSGSVLTITNPGGN